MISRRNLLLRARLFLLRREYARKVTYDIDQLPVRRHHYLYIVSKSFFDRLKAPQELGIPYKVFLCDYGFFRF